MSIKVMQIDICDGCADLDLKTEHHFSDNQLLYTQVFCKNYYICEMAYKAGKKESICKHGTWKKKGFERFVCSECGAYIRGDEHLISNDKYCYNCGAMMDGENKERSDDSEN